MASLNKSTFFRSFLSYLPIILLFFSVFNEFDFNYLKLDYFSFNFIFILIFFWTLRNPDYLGYFSIFLAGIINDVVIGIPIGISSFCYLLICAITSYIRQITLSPKFINDWLSFYYCCFAYQFNSSNNFRLSIFISGRLYGLLNKLWFYFLFYPLFFILFNILNSKISNKQND